MGSFKERLKHAWNLFTNAEDHYTDRSHNDGYYNYGAAYSSRPDRSRFSIGNEQSIVNTIYNKIGVDVSDVVLKHVRVDDNNRYLETIDSGLNNCLKVEANIDQAARAFRQDIAMTLMDKGVIAIVPTVTTADLNLTSAYDVKEMRVGEIVQWYPRHVRVRIYDDRETNGGVKREITLPKSSVAIIENPFYTIMNEQNSTLKRLIRKLNLLDAVDEQSNSGKLDLLIQLPYAVKSEARRKQAEQRHKDIELQLAGSQYGIAYIDGTEKITQLNRPAENNLLAQVKYLTEMLYDQLGLTASVFNGTADEATMLNYMNRTITPIVDAIVEGMSRTFLSKTARSQGQTIAGFRDPFKLVPISAIAEIADKFTRNEILSTNDVRQIIGITPVNDPKADELRNKNLPIPEDQDN